MAANMRTGIANIVNNLNKVRNNTTIAQQQIDLQKIINVYFILWQQVIYDQLDRQHDDYKAAIKSLSEAEKASKEAIKDMEKVVDAIKKANRAAKSVDKVINFAIKLLI